MTGRSREGSARAQKHVPSSAILVGSVAAERSYRALGTLTPGLPVPGGGGGGGVLMLALCPFFL